MSPFEYLFDDFDTQKQSDEDTWESEFLEWFSSQISPYMVYEVDCDDGTEGDLIYEWTGHPDFSI